MPTAPTMQMRPRSRQRLKRVLRRRRRFRGRRHDRAIHAASIGEPAHRFQCGSARNPVIGAEPARQVHAPAVQIDAHHHAALQAHQLRHQLAHQAEPDHRHHVAQFDARRAHRIHRDAAQRGETGVLARHAFGHTRRQIAPHQDGLAVPRAFAAISHALADLEIGHRGVARRHHAGAGVSQHGILGEFRAHLRDASRPARSSSRHPRSCADATDCRPPPRTGCRDGYWPSRFRSKSANRAAAPARGGAEGWGPAPRPR